MGIKDCIKRLFGFGYQAAEGTPRRKAPNIILRSEDDELWTARRTALIGTTRDLMRNFAVARWGVGKHLDYVSSFSFQSRTGVDSLDRYIEDLMYTWSLPQNCDVTGRHDFTRLTRLLEGRAVVDGDCWWVKLASGQIQAIEGDRIRNPGDTKQVPIPEGGSIVNGVVLGPAGNMVGVCVCKRSNKTRFEFEQFVPSQYVIHHGYYDRYDQVRGISPLASGLNAFRDVMEASEYALLKAKIVALFGLKVTRQDADVLPQSVDQDADDPGYMVDFGKGPFLLDLQPGDDAEFLESSHPSTQFQDFMQASLGIALKSLDIPLSFYDESFTNYSGARQAWIQYNQSADQKRNQLRRALNDVVMWKLGSWIASGTLQLPSGMTIFDLNWEWVGTGVPWLNPLQEVQANIAAINSGQTSRQRLCKERGQDWNEIVQELAAEQQQLLALGLNPNATPIPMTITVVASGDEGNNTDE